MALQLRINVSLNRPPDHTWRRPPGRPRNKWLNQLRNDSTHPIGELWRRAVDRGHGGATTRRPRRLHDHETYLIVRLQLYSWRRGVVFSGVRHERS